MYKINEISKALATINDSATIEEFLNSILTENEIKEISSRWELVKLLRQGKSQRKIAEELKLSLCKITRGSKELKKESSPFENMLKIYENLKK